MRSLSLISREKWKQEWRGKERKGKKRGGRGGSRLRLRSCAVHPRTMLKMKVCGINHTEARKDNTGVYKKIDPGALSLTLLKPKSAGSEWHIQDMRHKHLLGVS